MGRFCYCETNSCVDKSDASLASFTFSFTRYSVTKTNVVLPTASNSDIPVSFYAFGAASGVSLSFKAKAVNSYAAGARIRVKLEAPGVVPGGNMAYLNANPSPDVPTAFPAFAYGVNQVFYVRVQSTPPKGNAASVRFAMNVITPTIGLLFTGPDVQSFTGLVAETDPCCPLTYTYPANKAGPALKLKVTSTVGASEVVGTTKRARVTQKNGVPQNGPWITVSAATDTTIVASTGTGETYLIAHELTMPDGAKANIVTRINFQAAP